MKGEGAVSSKASKNDISPVASWKVVASDDVAEEGVNEGSTTALK